MPASVAKYDSLIELLADLLAAELLAELEGATDGEAQNPELIEREP